MKANIPNLTTKSVKRTGSRIAWLGPCGLSLFLTLGSPSVMSAKATDCSCERDVPVEQVVKWACRSKKGFEEYTNTDPCQVHYYLKQTTATTTNLTWHQLLYNEAGSATYWNAFSTRYLYWGPGDQAQTNNVSYDATKVEIADWNTGFVVSNWYSGSYANLYSIYNNGDTTNNYYNTATGSSLRWAYGSGHQIEDDGGSLSTNGWVLTFHNESAGYTYYFESINPNISYSNTNIVFTSDFCVTNPSPSVAEVGVLTNRQPTHKLYVFVPQPDGGWGQTTFDLTNEYTTAMLMNYTSNDLAAISFDAETNGNCNATTMASARLSNCEKDARLSKLRFRFQYETETNKTYLVTRVFNLFRNGTYAYSITLSNLVAGEGITQRETGEIIPVAQGKDIQFMLGDRVLAVETLTNANCCTDCPNCEMTLELGVDSVKVRPYTQGDCGAGPGKCGSCPGGPGASMGSVVLKFGLGSSFLGQPVGELKFETRTATNLMWSAQSLYPLVLTNLVTLIANPNRSLRQVGSSQCLADIAQLTAYKYQVAFYATNTWLPGYSGSALAIGGLTPFVTWTVENPDGAGATNRLLITETRGSLQITNLYTWSETTQGWTLISGNGIRKEITATTWDSNLGTRTETYQMIDPKTSQVVAARTSTYKTFYYGERLIEEIEGAGGATRTNSYTYWEDASCPPAIGMLASVANGDGSWQVYTYDTHGRVSRSDAPFGQSGSASVSYYYADSGSAEGYSWPPPAFMDDTNCWPTRPRMTRNTVGGVLVGQSYFVASPGQTIDIRCANTAGSILLCTTNRFLPADDTNVTRLQSTGNPDGTVSLITYSGDQHAFTVTTCSGQPNSGATTVVDGTKTATTFGVVGQVLTNQVWDISTDHPGGILLEQEVYTYSDDLFRSHTVRHLDGTSETVQYACCGLDFTVGRDGASRSYFYDSLKRRVAMVENDFGITTSNILDVANNQLAEIRSAGGSQITNWSRGYDLLGRVLFETNALGGVTTNIYGYNGTGLPQKQTLNPDGGSRVEVYCPDGRLLQVTGDATAPVRYTYTAEALTWGNGETGECTKETRLDNSGNETAEWTKTFSDNLGRTAEIVYPDYSWSDTFYNGQGQLSKQVDPDGVATVYQYNAKGELEYTALKMDAGSSISFGGADRITRTVSDVLINYSTAVRRTRTYVWPTLNDPGSNLVSVVETAADGLRSWRTVYRDPSTAVTSFTQTVPGAARSVTNVAPDNSFTVSLYSYGRLTNVLQYDGGRNLIGGTAYAYDSFGRQRTVTDARNGAATYVYNNADQVTSVTTPLPGTGQPAQTTSTLYDKSLRAWKVIQPDGTCLTNEFYPTGQLKKTSGSRTYPVAYTYDYAGRMQTMQTWRNFASSQGAATTTWNYHETRGWLTSKWYPDPATGQPGSTGLQYYYTVAGRLNQRSGVELSSVRTYVYGTGGDLNSIAYYSPTTPALGFTYNRLGRLATATQTLDGLSSTATLTYNDAGQLLSESYSGGALDGLSVTNGFDQLMRRTNLAVLNSSTALLKHAFGYDPASRLQSVTDGSGATPLSATYTYLDKSPLVGQIFFTNNGAWRMTTSKQFDHLNRLQSISSSPSSSPLSAISFSYSYNNANQRISTTLSDGSQWIYQYDPLGQVVSGKRYWADQTPVAGQQFEYGFDDIGNRTQTKAGGDQNSTGLRSASYGANMLNQYTNRTVPGAEDVMGAALAGATVTVTGTDGLNNAAPVYRKGEYFRKELLLDNTNGPLWEPITVSATGQSSVTGNVFLPQTPEPFTYDGDGNLTGDGRWLYTWDGEGRLVGMEPNPNLTLPEGAQRKLEFTYDYQGRRIGKTVNIFTNGGWSLVLSNRFLYDGWNLVAELNATNNAVIRSYLWGTDLSGTMQGAGGVGGLLAVTYRCGAQTTNCFVAFDGNGNVAALINAADCASVAQYEYAPFGEVVRATGPMARANPMRFSTKYQDDETDLITYPGRPYSPSAGGWLGRDSINENGGLNLYGFVRNDPVRRFDALGQADDSSVGWPYPDPKPGEPPPSYPPSMPFQKPPSKMFRKYDCSCCGKDEIDAGLNELKSRFGLAQSYLDPRVRPGRNGDLDANDGGASCAYSNERLLEFIQPTPRCWICFMDRKWDKDPSKYHPAMLGDYWDENFVHCFSVSQTKIRKEVVFDYFEYRYYSGKKGNGIYEDAGLQQFYKHHPYQGKSQAAGWPKFLDCSSRAIDWSQNNVTLSGVGRGGTPSE